MLYTVTNCSKVFRSLNNSLASVIRLNNSKLSPYCGLFFKQVQFLVNKMHSLIDIPCAITFLSCLVLVWSTPLGLSPTGDVSVSPILEYNRYLGSGSCMLAYINTTYNTSDGMIHSDNTESGKYGETNVGSAYGVLIHVRSVSTGEPTACTSPLTTYSTPDGRLPVSEPWIALIKRGQCEFSLKVMNAVQSNASAVLVYNDKDTNVLDTMRIQSVFCEYPYFDITKFLGCAVLTAV